MVQRALGILTSGGDAQGMNAAVRAAVRAALARGVQVYAIFEGYEGMVRAGDLIKPFGSGNVGGILHRGGTVIGTARSQAFRTRDGRRTAAKNLVERGIDRLVIIGGDGSLTGANLFRQEWPELLAELVASNEVSAELAARHPQLGIVGLVGSIDNDMVGTDMTIGADTALHRITEALDALASTAASHQRTFVVEVMGRNCGYLALMGAIAGGADYTLIPENPPQAGWQDDLCAVLQAGRKAGRRDSIVVVAEGARDRDGNEISADDVRKLLDSKLGEDTRVTILGHVQRGGVPSAFDRWMSSLVGFSAAEELIDSDPTDEPKLIGMRYNRVTRAPLMKCVEDTRAVAQTIADRNYEQAMAMRGGSFTEMFRTFHTLAQVRPTPTDTPGPRKQVLVMHAGAPAPGMNTALRAAVRLALDQGHEVLIARDGFPGLMDGLVERATWGTVSGFGSLGGAELGTNRTVPNTPEAVAAVARQFERNSVDALLMIGGWAAIDSAHALVAAREHHTALRVPMIIVPATIDNNLPGSELSIGADTALNNIVRAVDQIKQSAVAGHRCFVVEVMGNDCGYLALMSGLATGAERVYIPEEETTIHTLVADVEDFKAGFGRGRRLALVLRNEAANPTYDTQFLVRLFEQEGGDLYAVRQAILGHLQQGGNPTPFDRIQATRLAARAVEHLSRVLGEGNTDASFIGISQGKVRVTPLADLPALADANHRRPRNQWWRELGRIAETLARSDL